MTSDEYLAAFWAVHPEWKCVYDDEAPGLCQEACDDLYGMFPDELCRVFGRVVEPDGEVHGHWWCVVYPTNEVVDPTASQFDHPIKYRF